MKTVHKYFILITDVQTVQMPAGATTLLVGLDPNGLPAIWAHVDTDQLPANRTIVITGTGRPGPDGLTHLGSFVQGWAVWHVWEKV